MITISKYIIITRSNLRQGATTNPELRVRTGVLSTGTNAPRSEPRDSECNAPVAQTFPLLSNPFFPRSACLSGTEHCGSLGREAQRGGPAVPQCPELRECPGSARHPPSPLPHPRTCAVNCAFCCSAATRRCNSASSASPSSAIVSARGFAEARTRGGSAPPPAFRFTLEIASAFFYEGRDLLHNCFPAVG